jgi:signal transduction histidine kinase
MPEDATAGLDERLNALGQLAAGVGHHVINAFSAIVSNAEILRLSSQGNGHNAIDPTLVADLIIKTGLEASGVARRLIDVSRSATTIGDGAIALDELAAEVLREERLKGFSAIEWRADLAPVPPVKGHAGQLRAMLRHLIDNARESLPPSGGTIIITTSIDDRGWVVIEVADDGFGMPQEIQVRAVEPFFSTKPGRTGIGLSVANGIWRRHRGTLAILSKPGAGTKVRLCVEPRASQSR